MPEVRCDGGEMPVDVREAVGRLGELVMAGRASEVLMTPSRCEDFNLCAGWLAGVRDRADAVAATSTLVEQLAQAAVILDRISAWGGPFGSALTGRVLH